MPTEIDINLEQADRDFQDAIRRQHGEADDPFAEPPPPLPDEPHAAHLIREACRQLAMLDLTSERYGADPEYRAAVDRALSAAGVGRRADGFRPKVAG